MHIKKLWQERSSNENSILALVLTLLSMASLFVWFYSPIFPDEIALRLLSGRFIQDGGLSQKLFYICPSNSKDTPLLFTFSALTLSWIDLHLSLIEIRALPFIVVIFSILFSIIFAIKGQNKSAAIIATISLIGVAGSGLIIARAEYWQILNIALCIMAYLYIESVSMKVTSRFVFPLLLLLSVVFSIYIHPQGLLFLPITLYLIYLIVGPVIGKINAILILTLLLIFITYEAVAFMNHPCVEYPGIQKSINAMAFNFTEFNSVTFSDWLSTHIQKYLQSFYYKDSYQINYLPGVPMQQGWQMLVLPGLNQSIQFILITNLILFVCASIAGLFLTTRQLFANLKYSYSVHANTQNLRAMVSVTLFSLPIIFLFLYDANQNFYPSFFINLLISIILTMLLSRIHAGKFSFLLNAYCALSGLIVVLSLLINTWWFEEQFRQGFEGPSMSTHRDWDKINLDVITLAQESKMDLSKGKIIVDDMTYESLKNYSFLYPITYLDFSGSLSKLSSTEIINKITPNYAITRCDYMHSWGITPQFTRNQFCAINFLTTAYQKHE